MPLFNIIGLTPRGGTFYIAFGFISDEREGSFRYILERLADLYTFLRLQPPAAVVTNKDDALLNAIWNTWPSTAALICIWHINKNILSHAKWAIRDYLLMQSTPTASTANEKEFLKQIDNQ
jgi:transposase-like protein